MILSVTGQPLTKNHNHYIGTLYEWTRDVIAEQRETNRAAAGELPDNAVNACPEELPEGFTDWIRREILTKDNTLVYKKGNLRGTCALCGREVRTTRANRFIQYQYVNCPDCGEEVLCVLSGSAAWKADYVCNVAAIQRGKDGIVWFRHWHLCRDEKAHYDGGLERYLVEICRYAMRGRKIGMWRQEAKYSNYMSVYRESLDKWERCTRFQVYDGSYAFYPQDIAAAVEGTSLQYADLEGYIHSDQGNKCVIKYAADFARYPVMEFFWKTGYKKIINQKVNGAGKGNNNAVLWNREKLSECIRFPLRFLKVKAPDEWTMSDMVFMRELCTCQNLTDTEWLMIMHLNISSDTYQYLARYSSATKTLNYLSKQRGKESVADTARTYRDYIRECEQLQYNLTLKEVLFPKSLTAAHERTMRMVAFENNRPLNEKLAKQLKKLEKFSWENDGLLIRPATNTEELKQEGERLKHCVGSYAKSMAEGHIAIFFIRAADAPDEPYFTLELKNKRVVQCRTKNNKPYDGDVQEFVNAWLKDIVEKGGRRNQRTRVAVR